MNKLLLVAAFGAAVSLTACSDDSSSNASSSGGSTQLDGKTVVSCDKVQTVMGMENHSCHAIAADDAAVESFKSKCAPISDLDKTVYMQQDRTSSLDSSFVTRRIHPFQYR